MIHKVGVEFEGGWRGERNKAPFPGYSIKGDGSVQGLGDIEECTHYGELVSEPLDPDKVPDWVEKHVPHFVNDTCGTHVHFSFRGGVHTYSAMMEKKFHQELMSALLEYANRDSTRTRDNKFCSRLKDRMAGRNSYCKNIFYPMLQVLDDARNSSRYTHINFCHRLHGTIEIRVLPGIADPVTAREVLSILIALVSEFSSKRRFKRRIRFRR